MDFHALPRRDLQALCKRNSIRANMTNAAMADALSALPAVDGIEEYVKQPAAEPTPEADPVAKAVTEEEIPPPRGRRVSFNLPEPIMREDEGKEKRGLKRDEHKDTALALGLGRCALAEPLVAPATKRRAVESKTETSDVASEAAPVLSTRTRRMVAASKTEAGGVAAETVPAPAPTTRGRRQRTVAVVAEEKVLRARQTARKVQVPNTDMQQEEEGEGTQGVISDVKNIVPAPVSDEGRDEPVDMEEAMNPENEKRDEIVEELSQEEEEISQVPMETAIPVESEDCTDNSSVQEPQVDVIMQQSKDLPVLLGLVEQVQDAPLQDVAGSGDKSLDDEMIHHSNEETETATVKEEAQAMLKLAEATENLGEVPTTILDEEMIHHSSEETKTVPVEEAQAMLKSAEVTENVFEVLAVGDYEEVHSDANAKETGSEDGLLLEEKESLAIDEVLQDTAVAVEEEGVVATDKMSQSSRTMNVDVAGSGDESLDDEMIHHSNEETETATVKEEAQAMLKLAEATENLVEVPTTVLDEEMIHHSSEETKTVPVEEVQAMLKSAEVTENVFEVPAVGDYEEVHSDAKAKETGSEDGLLLEEKESLAIDEVLQDTAVAVEEEGVVATDKMSQSSRTMNVDVEEVVFAVNDLSQVTATHVEVAGKESAFTGDLEENEAGTDDGFLFQGKESLAVDEVLHDTDVAVEEEVVAVEEVVFAVNDLSQVTSTHVEVAGKESAFTGDLEENEAGTDDGFLFKENESLAVDEVLHDTDVAVEEEGVVAVEEVVFPVNDLPQVTATHVEVAGEESAFTGDLEENEAGTDDGFLFKEKESLAVDEVLHDTDVAVEEEGVVATDKMLQSSATVNVDGEEVVFAVNDLSQVTATHAEVAGEESAFTGDLEENEAGTEDGFLFKEKESLAVDEVLHDTDVAVEEEGVVATDKMSQRSVNVDVEEVVIAVRGLSQVTATHVEVSGEESAFTGNLEENEAGTDDGFLFKEKESLAVDEVLHETDVAVDEVLAIGKMPESSATVHVDVQEVLTVDDLSQVTGSDVEGAGEERAFTSDLPPVFDTARNCSEHSTSPFFAGMFDDDPKSMSIDSVIVEPKVPEETCDVSPCMYNNSNEKNITKSVSVEQKKVKESNKSEAVGNLSLRKLRVKFKETMAVGQENEVKEGKKSMDSIIVEPKVSEEAGDGSLCVYNNSNENDITQSVALEQEEVKESNKFDAIGNLRVKFKETVAAGQENEVKKGMPLDKLSLRKLKIKLKETLIARESREPNRAPLGKLDENAC